MTKIECLTKGMTVLAHYGLTIDDGAILLHVFSQLNGLTRHQIEKAIGRPLQIRAMANLAMTGITEMKKKKQRHYWFITLKGKHVIMEMLGEVKEPA